MLEIEKNIPIPEAVEGRAWTKYPFQFMEIGDSFFLPCDDIEAGKNRLRTSFVRHKPKRFSIRKVKGGLRVWRVE